MAKAYLVGGGIASLSAAVYLINDGKFNGKNITIFDTNKNMGGSLDSQNLSTSKGYVMRGVRMFEEETFTSAFDLMKQIPSLTMPGKNLREEFTAYNKKNTCYSKTRLFEKGQVIDLKPLRLKIKDRIALIILILRREKSLDNLKIEDYFTLSFFQSNFWYEFRTVFAFQPFHSLMEFRRYFIRFIQSFPKIDTLENVEIAPYNQYQFLVLPTVAWLKEQGVNFKTKTTVINFNFAKFKIKQKVNSIRYIKNGQIKEVKVQEVDFVFTTLGSLTANSSLGSMQEAPILNYEIKSPAWTLWENIAKNRPEFGKPSVFNSHIEQSKWTSFTLTLRDPLFFELMQKFVSKKPKPYDGFTLIKASWFVSITLSYNPYFVNQPKNVDLCWGFGLNSDKKGDFIKKKMSECTGEEILTELVYQLGFEKNLKAILKSAVCIPCSTPYVTSVFLPRAKGDRPATIPQGYSNLAFLGQYSEIPKDVVFTVEYSIRSAQIAVYKLLKINKKTTPIYNGFLNPLVLFKALLTFFR